MIYKEQEIKLTGDHFLVNISLPLEQNGVAVIGRDPRRLRIKPGCYSGTVEEIGSGCKHVKVGDRVVFERWQWQQMDIDDERMIARERDLMVINDNYPAPNVIVIDLPREKALPLNLISIDRFKDVRPASYHGMVVATSANPYFGEVGEEVWVESYDYGQFIDGNGRLFFRTDKVALVLMRLKRTTELQVI